MSETALLKSPQVKICGLTSVEQALACAELGADAVGCVFYPPSPRHVSESVAEAICRSLPASVWPVGVFVNQPYREIIGKVRRCGLRAVQLHGQETPELVQALGDDGVLVIKTLFANANPFFDAVRQYAAHAYLVECAGERLPGGNAKSWDWSAASGLVSEVPVMLAGGLTPENVAAAIQAARPAAVDVSSGVERIPGQKDLTKVKLFIEAVQQNGCSQTVGEVFP